MDQSKPAPAAALKQADRSMAVAATLHCLAGCSIGEIIGMVIGSILNFSNLATTGLAFTASFVCGYSLSMLPLLQAGLPLAKAFRVILAADTVSILTMEVVDNLVMLLVPGAMNASLVNPLYWLAMPLSLAVAFVAAVPVNAYLLLRGQGHALTHAYHHGHAA